MVLFVIGLRPSHHGVRLTLADQCQRRRDRTTGLPAGNPSFDFAIPEDGSLPLDGAAPSLIDHRGDPTSMASIPDLGARLRSLTLEHPNPAAIETLYRDLSIDHPPAIVQAPKLRYRALIETPTGLKVMT